MKYLPFCFLAFVLSSEFSVQAQNPVKLGGLWRTDHGVLVNFEHSGSSLVAKYINPGDCVTGKNCILDVTPAFFVKGTVSGNRMELTMMRCTHDSAMRADGLSKHYTRPCVISEFSADEILGTYRTEHYQREDKDGKLHFRRDSTGDRDEPFGIYRTNCRKELEDLVAELERKRASLYQIRAAIEDVHTSAEDAPWNWYREIGNQAAEDAWQTLMPPSLKCAPGVSFSCISEIFGYYGEKMGNLALENFTKIIGLYDLLIDWMNVMAKGKVTVDEIGQINEGLENIYGNELNHFSSYIEALREYDALSKLCEKEIPKDQQPKLAKDFHPEVEAAGNATHDEARRVLGNMKSNVQNVSNELSKTSGSIKKLEGFLKPYRNQDPNKKISEVFNADKLKKLNDGIREILQNWMNLLKSSQSLEEEWVKLKGLYKK